MSTQPNDIRLRKRNRTKSADILKPQNNIPEKRNSDQHNTLQKYTKSSDATIEQFGWDEKLEPVSRLKRTLSGKFRKESKIIQDQLCAVGTLPVDDTVHKLIRQHISVKQFEKQIRKMMHIDQVDSKGQSCLHLCCSKGNVEFIKILIRRGANINLRDLMGFTPLHCSVIEKRLDSCEALLSCKGIDLTITNSENSHPIHYLVRVPVTDENVVQYRSVLDSFIKGGVDVNIQSKHGEAPIHFASMTGNVHPVAFLLEHGANCNLKTFIHGETPLHYATRAGNMKIVRMLMENGADPTIKALETGDTPIDVAEQYQATDILDCFQSIIEDILESKAYSNTIPTLVKHSGSVRLVENSKVSSTPCWITVENHLLVSSTDQHRGEVKFKFSIAKAEVNSSDDIEDEESGETLKTWVITLPEGEKYTFATSDEDRAAWINFISEALQLTSRLSEIHEKLKSLSNPRKKLRLEERNLASFNCNEGMRVLTAAIKCNSKEELLRLVRNEVTASALCEIVNPEDEPLIKSLVKFFLHHGLLINFMKAAITYTIRKTTVGETLFREMSLATRMISVYLEMEEGKEYIKTSAAELLNSISTLDFAMDSNPNLFNGERFTNPNVEKIIESAQTFLDKISTSASKWPPLFRELMAHTKNKVDTVFPNMTHAVVGGFVFLRFLCPAIVTPHKFGLVSKPPDNRSLRIYVLITKILQSVSNGVEFDGSKEEYMQRFNPFIRKNRLFVEYFFNGLTNTSDLDTSIHLPKPLNKEELASTEQIIFESIVTLKDKMLTYLSTNTTLTAENPEPEQQTDD